MNAQARFGRDLEHRRVAFRHVQKAQRVAARAVVAGDAESYRYLYESIRRFPSQRELAERLRKSGFANVTWRNMSMGIVALHGCWRI